MAKLSDDEREGATIATFMPHGFEFERDEEELEWKEFLDEMGDAIHYAKITVYRVPTHADGSPAKRQMAYCLECGLGEYSFSQLCQKIQELHGSGLYRIQARDKNGVIRKNKPVAIEAPKGEATAQGDSSAGQVIDRMSSAMAAQQDRFEQILHRMTGREVDPIDQMTKIAGAMAAMINSMGLNQDRAPPQTALEKLTEMRLTMKIMREMTDGGDARGEGFWGAMADTAKSFAPALAAAISHASQGGDLNADGSLRRLPAPGAAPRPAREDHATKEPSMNVPSMNVDEVKPQLQFLLAQAKAKVEPADVVTFVLNALPEEGDAHESLEAFLLLDDCVQQCIAVMPEIETVQVWFGAWRALMLREIADMFAADDVDNLTGGAGPGDDTAREAGEGANPEKADATGESPAAPVDVDGDPKRGRGD